MTLHLLYDLLSGTWSCCAFVWREGFTMSGLDFGGLVCIEDNLCVISNLIMKTVMWHHWLFTACIPMHCPASEVIWVNDKVQYTQKTWCPHMVDILYSFLTPTFIRQESYVKSSLANLKGNICYIVRYKLASITAMRCLILALAASKSEKGFNPWATTIIHPQYSVEMRELLPLENDI